MAICLEYGIPHSQFMGGSGRWNELDRDKAVAYSRLMREACPTCHTLPEDWVGDNGIPLEEPILAAVMRHCYGCDEIERLREMIPKKTRGVYIGLIPFGDLTDEDDEWYDPDRDPIELEKRRQEALQKAPGMAGAPNP